MFKLLVVALVVVVATTSAAEEQSVLFNLNEAVQPPIAESRCSTKPQPTATFNPHAGCAVADPAKRGCWLPATGSLSFATVTFPASTHTNYSALSGVQNLIVESGATLVMSGESMQVPMGLTVSNCLFVDGNLVMTPAKLGGLATYDSFPHDPSVPMDQDCHTIADGFAPRICGPGLMVITGTVSVAGGWGGKLASYTSLFISVYVEKSGSLNVGRRGYIFSNVTNHGSLHTEHEIYLHGSIYNYNQAVFGSVIADRWAEHKPRRTTVLMYNEGNMTFIHRDLITTHSLLFSGKKPEASWDDTIKLVNKGTCNFEVYQYGEMNAYDKFDVFNYGMMNYTSDAEWGWATFRGWGSTVNTGIMTTSSVEVHLQDYMSHGGRLVTKRAGSFHFGNSAGVDKKTIAACANGKDKKRNDAPTIRPSELRCRPRSLNVSKMIDCKTDGDCLNGDCCINGTCGPSGCGPMGYGSGWCGCNGPCMGSSHGPYCGFDAFSWETEIDCLAKLEFVDRYDEEAMKRIAATTLPTFGRHRYTFRGNSHITGDGNGTVVFSEPIELLGELSVHDGGILQSVEDQKKTPLVRTSDAGKLSIGDGGRFVAGIRAVYDHSTPIVVRRGGVFEVRRYTDIGMHHDADVHVEQGGTMLVEGHLVLKRTTNGLKRVRQCGELIGNGTVVGDHDLQC